MPRRRVKSLPPQKCSARVAYSSRVVYVIDDLLNTQIMIFYSPAVRSWVAYLVTPDYRFIARVQTINACMCGVAEYCTRSYTTGNYYIDVCYCSPVYLWEINQRYKVPWEAIAAYAAGQPSPYRRYIRKFTEEIANYIYTKLCDGFTDSETAINDVFDIFMAEPDYYGAFVTAYKFCPETYYGIFCRAKPQTCTPVDCRDICDLPDVACDEDIHKTCVNYRWVYEAV